MRTFPDDLTVLLLCGGAAQRMGGVDKPLQELRGAPMVEHVHSALPGLPTLISANRHLDRYARYGRVITDAEILAQWPKAQGPLVGIAAGLANTASTWLLVCPGDTPDLSRHWWRAMYAAGKRQGRSIVSHDGTRQQHLHLLLHKSASTQIEQFIANGHHQVHRCLNAIGPDVLTFSHAGQFRNINTPTELAAARDPSRTPA